MQPQRSSSKIALLAFNFLVLAGLSWAGTEPASEGGVNGGQNQGKVGDLTEAGVIGAPGPELPSASPRNLKTLPFPNLSSGAGGDAGAGAGIRNQPLELKPNTNRRTSLLIGLYISQGVLQALDAQSTIRAIHAGSAQEGNALIRPFASQPAVLVGLKLALAAGTIYGIDRLYKYHPRLAMSTLGAINAGYVGLVLRNYRSFPSR